MVSLLVMSPEPRVNVFYGGLARCRGALTSTQWTTHAHGECIKYSDVFFFTHGRPAAIVVVVVRMLPPRQARRAHSRGAVQAGLCAASPHQMYIGILSYVSLSARQHGRRA